MGRIRGQVDRDESVPTLIVCLCEREYVFACIVCLISALVFMPDGIHEIGVPVRVPSTYELYRCSFIM
jgi:hypothetical protein